MTDKENILMREIFYDKLNIREAQLLYSDDFELVTSMFKALHKLGFTWRDGHNLDDIEYLKCIYMKPIRYDDLLCIVIDCANSRLKSNAIIGCCDYYTDSHIIKQGVPISKDILRVLAEVRKEFRKITKK